MRHNFNGPHQRGFTLIEVLVVSALMAILVALGSVFWQMTVQNYDRSLSHYRLTELASSAVRTLTTELRQAEEAMNGAYLLATLEDDELAFYADIDDDGLIERVRYWVSGTTFMKGVVKPTGDPPQYILSGEVVSIASEHVDQNHTPLFIYYNEMWPADTTNNPLPLPERPLGTRMIKVRVPLRLSDMEGEATFSAETTVRIRNLR